MAKFNLLLLDSVIVIRLHELGLWSRIIDSCDVHLTRTIVDNEVLYFEDGNGDRQPIDLSNDRIYDLIQFP